MCRTLEKAERRGLPADSAGVLKVMQETYKESQNERGRLNTDEYIRRVAPALSDWVPAIPMGQKHLALRARRSLQKPPVRLWQFYWPNSERTPLSEAVYYVTAEGQ
jgi:hypothetical protein